MYEWMNEWMTEWMNEWMNDTKQHEDTGDEIQKRMRARWTNTRILILSGLGWTDLNDQMTGSELNSIEMNVSSIKPNWRNDWTKELTNEQESGTEWNGVEPRSGMEWCGTDEMTWHEMKKTKWYRMKATWHDIYHLHARTEWHDWSEWTGSTWTERSEQSALITSILSFKQHETVWYSGFCVYLSNIFLVFSV